MTGPGRVLRTGLIAAGVVAGALLAAAFFVLGTNAGARWLVGTVSPDGVAVSSVEGRILGPLLLEGVSVETPGLRVRVDSVVLEWRPGRLLDRRIDVSRLDVAGVSARSRSDGRTAAPESGPPRFDLPLPVRLRRAEIRRLTWIGAVGDTTLRLERAAARVSVESRGLRVDSLDVSGLSAGTARIEGSGALRMGGEAPHPVSGRFVWSGRISPDVEGAGAGELAGDLRELRLRHALDRPLAATLDLRVRGPLGARAWSGELRVPAVDLSTVESSLPALEASADVRAGGTPDSAAVVGTFRVSGEEVGRLDGIVGLGWTPERLVLDSLALAPEGRGRLIARGHAELEGEPRARIRAEWSHLRWPMVREASFRSPGGELSLEGAPGAFDYELDAEVVAEGVPAARVRVGGDGARSGDTLSARASAEVEVEGMPLVRSTLQLRRQGSTLAVDEVVAMLPGRPARLEARGELALGAEPVRTDLRLDWRDLHWPLGGEALVESSAGDARIRGSVDDAVVRLDAHLAGPSLPGGRWSGEARATRTTDGLGIEARIRGVVADSLEIRSDVRLTRSEDRVRIHALDVRTPASGGRIDVRGELRPGASMPLREIHAEWTGLAWPLSGPPVAASRAGALEAVARDDRLDVGVRTTAGGYGIPEGEWHLAGSGTAADFVVDSIRGEVLGGRVSGRATLHRDSALAWSAVLEGRELAPERLLPEWPGLLDVELDADGAFGDGGPRVEVRRLGVLGTLRGRAFDGSLRGGWRSGDLRLDTLAVRSGGASVAASGTAGAELDLAGRVDAPALDDLLPDARGGLRAEGRVSGDPSRPRVRAIARGSELRYGAVGADSLAVDASVDLGRGRPSDVRVRGRAVTVGGIRLDSLRVDGEGEPGEHRVRALAAGDQGSLTAALDGSWSGEDWGGSLTELTLTSRAAGEWGLVEPSPVRVTRGEGASLERTCWRGPGGELCLRAEAGAGSGTRWSASGRGVPLAFLSPLFPPAMWLDGRLQLDSDGRLAPGATPEFRVHALADSASLMYRLPGEDPRRRPITALEVRASMDRDGLRGDGELRFAEGDSIGVRVATVGQLEGGPEIDARLHGDLRDRGLFEVLSDGALTETRGRLVADLTATGTTAEPRFGGSVRLEGGGGVVPDLGVRISGLTMEARPDEGDAGEWRISAGAASGGGTVTADGSVRLPGHPEGWSGRVRIRGASLEAYRTALGHVLVSPDLTATVGPSGVAVDGEVRVPLARITAGSVPTAVAPAPDVRVLAPGRDSVATALGRQPAAVRGRVRIVLGEDVSLDASGLNVELGGELTIVSEPGRPPTANGTLEIERGSYAAYGQRLTIDRGRLVFVQSPLDDPGLDLRIVRVTGDVTAIMEVVGTLRRPRVSLSSEPPLSDDETLAYLLLGRPLSQLSQSEGRRVYGVAQSLGLSGGNLLVARLGALFGLQEARIERGSSPSDAQLVLGKQVLPRTQLAYAIGLLGRSNVLVIRYVLGRGWTLRTERGEEVGLDLLYELLH